MKAKEAVIKVFFEQENTCLNEGDDPVLISLEVAVKAAKLYAKQKCKEQRILSMLNATELKAKDKCGLEYIEKLVNCKAPKFD